MDDLIEVVEEQLVNINATIAEDIELFYSKRGRKPQDEGTLQAYFMRRLYDRLPGRVLAPNSTVTLVGLAREHQGNLLRRKDILVTAPCSDGAQAEVVIEIKWSSNPKVATSLTTQLGDLYLHSEGRTHGIYLVVWNGSTRGWKVATNQPPPRSWQDLRQLLDEQVSLYATAHSGLRVNLVVFDLTWPKKRPRRTLTSRQARNPSVKRAAQKNTSPKRKKK